MSEFWMRYVPHARVEAFKALGWSDLGPCTGHHGIYANTMRWSGDGAPPDMNTSPPEHCPAHPEAKE